MGFQYLCMLCLTFMMGSNLHTWEVLIALILSHFPFCVISQSFNPGMLTASGLRTPLTLNSTTRKWSPSLIQLSVGRSSTPASPFQSSPSFRNFSTKGIASIYTTDIRNGDSIPGRTPTSTSFQSSATSPSPTITMNSQSSLTASSTTPSFIVPTVISTISTSLDTNVPQSSITSAIFVTNPSDPNQVVRFETLQIPESQRIGLPSVTDTSPAALRFLNFGFPVLLFPSFTIVFPVISSLSPWLSL